MDESPTRPCPPNLGLTLADCAALVLGSALALSLPVIGSWGVNLWTFRGLCGKAGLALLPLVLFRCFRLRRDIRPAEMLLAVLAAPLLVEAVDWSSWVMSSYMDPVPGIPGGWIPKAPVYLQIKPLGPYWWARIGAWSVGLAALIAPLIVRRRAPAWGRATLLVLFVLGSFAWAIDPVLGAVNRLTFDVLGGSDLFVGTGWAAVRAVTGLIPATVAASALLDAIARRGRLAMTEWLGITLSVVSFASRLAAEVDLLRWSSMSEVLAKAHLLALILSGSIAAGLLGLIIAHSLGVPGTSSSVPPDAPGA